MAAVGMVWTVYLLVLGREVFAKICKKNKQKKQHPHLDENEKSNSEASELCIV